MCIRDSNNSELFRSFIKREGKVEFGFTSEFSVPINARALEEIDQGSYKKYSGADFVDLRLTLTDVIWLKGDQPVSTIAIGISPSKSADLPRVKDAAADLPIFVRMSAKGDTPSFLKELDPNQKVLPNLDKVLLEGPSNNLTAADVVVSVHGGKSSYLTMPVRLLLPGRRT